MADTVDNHKLIVSLEARIRSYEKAIERSQKQTDQRMRGIEKALKRPQKEMDRLGQSAERMEQRLARVGGVLKSFGAGLLGGIAAGGIVGIINQVGQVANGIARIGDEARRAGLSTKAFQELGYVAQQARVPVDALVDGIKELNLRADEFIVTGGGPAAEAFTPLRYTADELKTKLQDPSALFSEIIGKLGQLDRAAQIRIADEIFGGAGGEKFVQLISQGEKGIRDTVAEAHRLGLVLDEDVIARAAELDRQFNAVANTVGTALKRAIVEAATALQDFIAGFQGFEAQRTAKLDENLAVLGKERLDIEKKIGEVRARNDGMAGDGFFGTSFGDSGALGAIADYQRRLEAIAAEEQMILKALQSRSTVTLPAIGGSTPIVPASSSGGTKKPTEEKFKAERDAFAEMIGYTREYAAAQEAANRRVDEFGNLVINAGNSLATALSDGKLEGAELLSVLQQVATELVRMAQASGGFGNLFSSLFGGGGGGFNPTAGGFADMIFGGGLFHSGTASAQPGNLALPASMFSGAPRFHSGNLKGNEMAAILERGEAVLRARDMRRNVNLIAGMGNAIRGGGGGGTTIQFIDQVGVRKRTERSSGPDGETLKIIIEDVIDNGLQGGRFDGSLGSRFGARPQTIKR